MAFVMLGLGVQTFFSKKKAFPETRISRNKAMRSKKIYCAETQLKIDGKKSTTKGCSACY